MKRILLPLISMVLMFASCEKTETFDDTRKIDNETQFARITANSEYKKIESKSRDGFIMYKVIKENEESTEQKPIFTDKVKIYYTGWYKRFWTREDTFLDNNGITFKNKIIFDSTYNEDTETESPSSFSVSGYIDGFATALQHMQVGERWEVWIPWQLGYGASGNASIQGYSTLVFEIELLEIL